MARNSWEVSVGYGDQILSRINEDITKWDKFGHNLAALEVVSEGLDETARRSVDGVVGVAFGQDEDDPEIVEASDIDQFIDMLDPAAEDDIVAAFVADAVLTKLSSLKQGTGFGVYGKRARLTVVEPGVNVTRPNSSNDFDIIKTRLKPGTIVEGRIEELSSVPEVGGRLIIRKMRLQRIDGLADLEDGHPRVKLDILHRN